MTSITDDRERPPCNILLLLLVGSWSKALPPLLGTVRLVTVYTWFVLSPHEYLQPHILDPSSVYNSKMCVLSGHCYIEIVVLWLSVWACAYHFISVYISLYFYILLCISTHCSRAWWKYWSHPRWLPLHPGYVFVTPDEPTDNLIRESRRGKRRWGEKWEKRKKKDHIYSHFPMMSQLQTN